MKAIELNELIEGVHLDNLESSEVLPHLGVRAMAKSQCFYFEIGMDPKEIALPTEITLPEAKKRKHSSRKG